jgi:hypothetical protein
MATVERGLDPAARRLFIIELSKALSKAIGATFGRDRAIQRCQIHALPVFFETPGESCSACRRRALRITDVCWLRATNLNI